MCFTKYKNIKIHDDRFKQKATIAHKNNTKYIKHAKR